jgi:prolyl-tRNA synthetase
VVIVPIYRKDEQKAAVLDECAAVKRALEPELRVHIDSREGMRPGWKFNFWELKGVPLRIEVGPKDLEKGQLCLARRFQAAPESEGRSGKEFVKRDVALAGIPEILAAMQREIYERALDFQKSRSRTIDAIEDFERFFTQEGGGFSYSHWCGSDDCERALAETYKTTIRTIPAEENPEPGACIRCGKPSPQRVVMAQSY